MSMRHIVICCLSGSVEFSNIIQKKGIIFEKKSWTWNVDFDFLYKFCLKELSF